MAKKVSIYEKLVKIFYYEGRLCSGGESHMKGAGMLVVSLRGVNFRSWSRLRCSGQHHYRSLLGLHSKKY